MPYKYEEYFPKRVKTLVRAAEKGDKSALKKLQQLIWMESIIVLLAIMLFIVSLASIYRGGTL